MNLVAILVPRFRVLDAEIRLREQFYAMSKADRDAYLRKVKARTLKTLIEAIRDALR